MASQIKACTLANNVLRNAKFPAYMGKRIDNGVKDKHKGHVAKKDKK